MLSQLVIIANNFSATGVEDTVQVCGGSQMCRKKHMSSESLRMRNKCRHKEEQMSFSPHSFHSSMFACVVMHMHWCIVDHTAMSTQSMPAMILSNHIIRGLFCASFLLVFLSPKLEQRWVPLRGANGARAIETARF